MDNEHRGRQVVDEVIPTVVLDESMLDNEERVYKTKNGFFVTRGRVDGFDLADREEYLAFLDKKKLTREAIIEAGQKRRAEAALQKENEQKAAAEETLEIRRLHKELQEGLREMRQLAAQMKKTPKAAT